MIWRAVERADKVIDEFVLLTDEMKLPFMAN